MSSTAFANHSRSSSSYSSTQSFLHLSSHTRPAGESRQKNTFAVLALEKLPFVRRENQRQVRKLRHLFTESLVKQNLFMRIRQMVLAAYDVRDAHLDVIKHD